MTDEPIRPQAPPAPPPPRIGLRRPIGVGPVELTPDRDGPAPAPPAGPPPADGPLPGSDRPQDGPQDWPLTWPEFLRWRRDWGPPPEWRAPIELDALDEAVHALAGSVAGLARHFRDTALAPLGDGEPGRDAREGWCRRLGDALAAAADATQALTPGLLSRHGALRDGPLPEEQRRALIARLAPVRGRPQALLAPGAAPGGLGPEAREAVDEWTTGVSLDLFEAALLACELCDYFRRLRWDRASPDPGEAERAEAIPLQMVLVVERLAIASGAGNLEDLAWAHMVAFERRHPEGWRPEGARRR